MDVIVISSLAEYQTSFWIPVAQELRASGHEIHFLSFDTRSNEMFARAELSHTDCTASAREAALAGNDPLETCLRFGLRNANHWLTHERFAFGISNSDVLIRKLAGTLLCVDRALAKIGPNRSVRIVQELGGFLSVIGTHVAAKRAGHPSWFIEPSFFRGRLLFTEGSLAAPSVPLDGDEQPPAEMQQYLAETQQSGLIVIPEKDRHQYTTAIRKIATVRNAVRLGQKLRDKYLLGKQHEFGHIGSHVRTHMRMVVESRKLRDQYTPLPDLGKFLYFPLHVPGDVALTLRSPEFLNQAAIIDYLCRVAPLDMQVVVKEHPAMIGAMGSRDLLRLKSRYDRFAILPPSTNNYDVLRAAAAVVTINSKSGAEAGLLGKNVLVLGDAFYRSAPFSIAVDALSELEPAILTLDTQPQQQKDRDDTTAFFSSLWAKSYPGELYSDGAENVADFARSLIAATGNR